VSFFGFRDDGSRLGFQAALHRADGTARPAAAAVRAAIEETLEGCSGEQVVWAPTEEVIGAEVVLGVATWSEVHARVRAGEDIRARVCVRTLGSHGADWAGRIADVAGELAGARCSASAVPGLHRLDVVVATDGMLGRSVEVTVALQAEANKRRRTVILQETNLMP
jgi:hypothetical protein